MLLTGRHQRCRLLRREVRCMHLAVQARLRRDYEVRKRAGAGVAPSSSARP